MEVQQGQNDMHCISLCYGDKLYKSVMVCIIFHVLCTHICHGMTAGGMLWGKGVHVMYYRTRSNYCNANMFLSNAVE